jgi:hypothetical protein
MKIIITIKDKKDVDSTVDKVLDIGSMLEKKFRGFKMGRCRCLRDGTTLVMER